MSTKTRKPCARCNNGKGVAACNGCQLIFCVNHFTQHREELSKLMDNVSQERDSLLGDLYQENLEHPFLSRIDNWEQESIKKIQTAAQAARTKLQEIFNRRKDEIKLSVEKLTNELQDSREPADYTEADINKWSETLKTLRKTLEDWSTVVMQENDHAEFTIHLIEICDQQSRSTVISSEEFGQICEESSDIDEKFDKADSDIILSEKDLVATCHSRLIFSNRFIYGVNRYSSGKHSTQFLIEKKGDTPIFLGIITSSKKYDHSFFSQDNSSVYGWYNIESFVISGKSQGYNEENLLVTGDELILIIDCNEQQILLQHQRTKRLFQIPVKLEKCPFPWKILVGLSNFNDCIRIVR
jgi:hypothetical protein